jgi:hypothetical protein
MEVAKTGKLAPTTKTNKSRKIEMTNHTASKTKWNSFQLIRNRPDQLSLGRGRGIVSQRVWRALTALSGIDQSS